jgi:site-specific recombinase XerD
MLMDQPLSLLQIRGSFESLEESWHAVALGFLVEKAGRSGSRRTAETYGRTIRRFLACVGDPARATPLDVHRFAYSLDKEGSPPSPSTVAGRLTAVGGLYNFAVRMCVIDVNPVLDLRRPVARPGQPRGLSTEEVARLLAVIPDTPSGLLDRAMIVTAVLTGLRRSEVAMLRVIAPTAGVAPRYEVRTKGGAVRRRELPDPAWQTILTAAGAAGRIIEAEGARAFPVSSATFYAHLRRHAATAAISGVSPHVLRHTAAKLRRKAGATIEGVCSLLGHQNISTTATYLRQLEDEHDDGWGRIASSLGLGVERTTAGPPTRSRPIDEVGRGGCWTSRPTPWRGAQVSAHLPRRDPTTAREPGGERRRRAARRWTRRRAATRP